MPLEKLSTASADASATDTLDRRVRRLARIIATAGGITSDQGTGEESREAVALRRLSAVADPLRQLTGEVESRCGASAWDAADVLGARLLVESLSGALRSCRLVTDTVSRRLQTVERNAKAARQSLPAADPMTPTAD